MPTILEVTIVRLPTSEDRCCAMSADVEQSILVYIWHLWGSTGIALVFTFVLACLVLWSSVFQARAEQARPNAPIGERLHGAGALQGFAPRHVR